MNTQTKSIYQEAAVDALTKALIPKLFENDRWLTDKERYEQQKQLNSAFVDDLITNLTNMIERQNLSEMEAFKTLCKGDENLESLATQIKQYWILCGKPTSFVRRCAEQAKLQLTNGLSYDDYFETKRIIRQGINRALQRVK